MAQVKVTSYYPCRKRADNSRPSKRRKLVPGSELITGGGTESELKIDVEAFTKRVLPRVDRAVLLQDISQSQSTQSQTSGNVTSKQSKPARKTRAQSTTKKTKTGPLDKHLSLVSKTTLPTSTSSEFQFKLTLDSAVVPCLPPSTPTKRHHQLSDEPPSTKKRSRLSSSANDPFETDVIIEPSSLLSKRRLRRQQEPTSRGRQSVRSARKGLEASLIQFAENSTPADGSKKEDGASLTCDKVSLAKRTGGKNPTSINIPTSPSPGLSSSLQEFIKKATESVIPKSYKGSNVKLPSATSSVGDSRCSQIGEKTSKLTPTEMKERLSKSCKLSDLQARLAKVKEFAEQAKIHQEASKKLSNVCSRNRTTLAESEQKCEEPAMPAYQKYHALVESAPPTLTLPFKYKQLEEMFRSTDTVVSMLHNRSETCSFSKLKHSVQELCRKTFELNNLGQIKTIYPTAYLMRQQKIPRRSLHDGANAGYELLIEANRGTGVGASKGQGTIEPVNKESTQPASVRDSSMTNLLSKFAPSMLIARRSIFHCNLINVVKEHHSAFLSKLDRPLSVPSDKLLRWHPKFPLDQIPDVEPSDLPKPPVVTTYNTARDVLDKARCMINPRVAKALEVVANNSALIKAERKEPKGEGMKPASRSSKPSKNEKAVSGVSQSLLERIRAKEANSIAAEMTRDPKEQERIEMLERLPEICRILRVFFVGEKKAALPLVVVTQKLVDSYPSALSKAQVEKHIALTVESLPDWLSKVAVRKDHYLKINKSIDMKLVNDRLKQLLRDSKQVKG